MSQPFHIVTSLVDLRGNEVHASALTARLREAGATVTLWSDEDSPQVHHFGGQVIRPFSGQIPRGGTLILLGTWLRLQPWISHCKPKRLILICNTVHLQQLYAMLDKLELPSLPPVELVYVSQRLRNVAQLKGVVAPPIMDVTRFSPALSEPPCFTVGRHSRDTADKHHPDDVSIYRLLSGRGIHVRLMGATVLAPALDSLPNVDILPVGAMDAPDFLRTLSMFFYRTAPGYSEAAGRVVMEALACGLPVVAHTSGGYIDWIEHGRNGFIFNTQDEVWEALLRLHGEAELRAKFRNAARESAILIAGQVPEYIDWLIAD